MTKILKKQKVSSAIKTDFILSLEIVIIALGTAMEKQHRINYPNYKCNFSSYYCHRWVYGIVALIVRMDDAGFI